jgi:hypothetical protein
MDMIALIIEVFGVGTLTAALVKNTMAKRKATQKDNTKNTSRRF